MEKVIEKLEQVKSFAEAIAELKALPRWETPGQHEKRTGERWPDENAVYFSKPYKDIDPATKAQTGAIKYTRWLVGEYYKVKQSEFNRGLGGMPYLIVIATEAGPPPDGWRPEEGEI